MFSSKNEDCSPLLLSYAVACSILLMKSHCYESARRVTDANKFHETSLQPCALSKYSKQALQALGLLGIVSSKFNLEPYSVGPFNSLPSGNQGLLVCTSAFAPQCLYC